ncbi:MAG TPA: DUF1801 domain-containing protein [Roseiflexaceae bacterium]|nr:DUF1801 domain-containing protein [Roseiflexaceae bacterium]
MTSSSVTTVDELLDSLPADRKAVVAAVRDVILSNLPPGYREIVQGRLIGYEIPLERYPNTYNRQPLSYIALGAQKNHYALYLVGAYQNPEQATWLKDAFARAGKKLDMGKSCLRFRRIEDLPLDVIGQAVASTSVEQHIASYEAARQR